MSFFNRKAGLGILLSLLSFSAFAQNTYTTMYPPVGGPYKYNTVTIGQSGNQYNPLLGSQSVLDADVLSLLADGWSTQSAGASQNTIYVSNYGAKCDGVTDDSAALNKAFAAFRTAAASSSGTAKMVFPAQSVCYAASSINATNISTLLGVVDMTGSEILCATNGTPCIDATNTNHLTWNQLAIKGSATRSPSIGLQLMRGATNQACGEQRFYNLITGGNFTQTAVYNLACETTTWNSPHIENDSSAAGAYALIMDAFNTFNLTSAFYTVTLPQNTANSFNENVFINATVVGSSSTVAPIWMGGTIRHRWYGSYELALGSPYGIALYDNGQQPNQAELFDIHVEGTAMTDTFLLTGSNASPVLQGFSYLDHQSQATNSYFKFDTGVTSATMMDARIDITQPGNAVKLFNTPSAWTVTGNIQVGANNATTYSQLGSFFGQWCAGTSCYQTVVLPSNISAGVISNAGGVATITAQTNSNFVPTASGITFPPIVISAPPSGGSQAAAHISSLQAIAYPTIASGGTGYQVGDVISPSGFTCSPSLNMTVTAVSSGVITGASIGGNPDCSVIPTNVAATTGGHGTGATMNIPNFRVEFPSTYSGVNDITIDSPGAGYLTAPTVSISGGPTAFSVTLSSALTISAGAGVILLNSGGVAISGHEASNSTYLTSAQLSGCGTTPSINATATDTKGTVTEGTTATGCVITFLAAYATAPDCTVTSPSGSALTSYSTSTSALTIVNASASGNKYTYSCTQ